MTKRKISIIVLFTITLIGIGLARDRWNPFIGITGIILAVLGTVSLLLLNQIITFLQKRKI